MFIACIAAAIADFVTPWVLPRSIGLASILIFAVVFAWQFIVLIKQIATDWWCHRRYRHRI
ncbi:TPA: hypothetical protein QDC20_006424 [Burkholderia aenigmatica]|uniref:hypothetical protein n=1 Tax=Burkholderia sp. AU45251 TaxID=3059204 RepID=UPI002650052D|nr:hypothetical protein [Burkholderia sp. AU45251]HDR9486062.1 hypothetical protein [Burkholderia aenigmatica]MDN7518782.1 hypothetical protein [Burkholderia sp. AU45251]HDR9517778.1 hypothetical protein [Burkholderia aenigmatica]HDR9595967.1 hypothetical protein [Burkholderia aenigmatica]HDR9603016.1 hypothetical protein [Burkholderia aenigmatica]